MTVPPLFAPKNPATQAACKTAALREMFVCPNHACRCALEMQPGKITRESAHERLDKSQKHDKQPRARRVEFRLNRSSYHIGKRHTQRAAKHQVRNNAQRREKNPQTKQKNCQGEPLDTAQVGSHVRLGRGINRLEKTFAENSVINHRPVHEPAESRCPVYLPAPFRRACWSEKDQMFKAQQ